MRKATRHRPPHASTEATGGRLTTIRARPDTPPLWQVYPQVVTVTARSGNQHYLLLVQCGHCRDIHQHRAPLGFEDGQRKAACGLGSYVLLVKTKAQAA